MKTSTFFVPLLLAILTSATPLGDRAIFARHRHTKLTRPDIRRFILRSDLNVPASCSSNLPPLGASSIANASIPDIPLKATLPAGGDDTPADSSDSATAPDAGTADATDGTDAGDASSDSTATKRHFFSSGSGFTSGSIISESSSVSQVSEISFSEYETLCQISGGSLSGFDSHFEFYSYGFGGCINWAGIDAVSALFAEADVCEQQHNADFMISWAKLHGGEHVHSLIDQAIGYRRYPRRVVEVLGYYPATPYCLEVPTNVELYGVWNEQFEGVNYGLYGGPNYPLISFGSEGSCPWGMDSVVDSCSCTQSSSDDLGNSTSTADESDSETVADSTSTDSTVEPTNTDSAVAQTATDTAVADSSDSDSGSDDSTSDSGSDSEDGSATGTDDSTSDSGSDSDDGSATGTDDNTSDSDSDSDDGSTTGTDNSGDDAGTATDTSAEAGNSLTPDISDPNGRRK